MDYTELIQNHPELFRNPRDPLGLKIILDPERIREWQVERRQKLSSRREPLSWAEIGVLLEDPYYLVVRDLVQFPDGHLNGYNRILGRGDLAGGQGVAVLPVYEKKILVMQQYRHPTRSWEYEIPRGYGEPGVPAARQARAEILEEIQGKIGRLHSLGSVKENTGAVAYPVALFLAELREVGEPSRAEGIKKLLWLPVKEFERWIATGKISDGFSMAAYTRAKLRKLI
jgi:ADP-ribose pyrophosphatase